MKRLVGIVMEHCGGGELFDHILSRDCLAEQDARRYFIQLISGAFSSFPQSRKVVEVGLMMMG